MGGTRASRHCWYVHPWSTVVLFILWFNLALPALDDTAVERQPLHDHLVYGANGERAEELLREHVHRFERPRVRHCIACSLGDEGQQGAGSSGQGIVILPDNDIAGSVLGLFCEICLSTDSAVSLPLVGPLSPPNGDLPSWKGATLRPPDPPPRAFLSTSA